MKEQFYKKSKQFLLIGLLIILIPSSLKIFGIFDMDIKFIFFFYIFCLMIFYFFRIDSRFLVFLAILLFGLSPFLLYSGFEQIADLVAIYAFYFLILTLILQLNEFRSNYKLVVNFKEANKFLFNKLNIYIALVCLIFVVISSISGILSLLKIIALYFSIIFLILHFIENYLKNNLFGLI